MLNLALIQSTGNEVTNINFNTEQYEIKTPLHSGAHIPNSPVSESLDWASVTIPLCLPFIHTHVFYLAGTYFHSSSFQYISQSLQVYFHLLPLGQYLMQFHLHLEVIHHYYNASHHSHTALIHVLNNITVPPLTPCERVSLDPQKQNATLSDLLYTSPSAFSKQTHHL